MSQTRVPTTLTSALPTIAAMQAIASPTTGMSVEVIEQGRGGTFVYDATRVGENDGGTVFNGWVRQFSGPAWVRWFGTTTADIQRAIDCGVNHVRFNSGDYIVEKNEALTNYPGNDQPCLEIYDKYGFTLSAEAGARLIVETHAQGILEIMDSSYVLVEGIELVGAGNFPLLDGTTGRGEKGTFDDGYGGLGFWTYYKNNSYPTDTDDRGGFGGLFPQWGGGTAGTWGIWNGGYIGNMGIGLLIHNNAHNIVVRNCKSTAFNYAGFGIGHNGDFFPVNLSYLDCTNIAFLDCIATDNFHAGISIMAVDGFQVLRCNVSNNGHPASVPLTDTYADPGYGWTAQATIYSAARNGQVSSCIANSNIRKGLDVHAGRNITITDNLVKGNAVCGIFSNWESTGYASLETSSIVISNNIISGNAFAPINLYQVYIGGPGPSKTLCDTVVSSNIFESSYSGGIRVRYASNVKVADNIFRGSALGGGPSQAFIDCQPNNGTASVDSNVVVTGNQIFDNDGFINAGIRMLFDYEDAVVSNNLIQMTGASVASGIGFTLCTNVHAYGNVARLGASGTPLALAGTGGLVYGNRGYGGNAPSTLVPATKTQARPVDSFSFKVAFNGTETPTISENTAPSYVASVQSLPTGFSVSFSGISSVAENFRAAWVITTAEGIVCIGTSNPFIYLRGVSNTAIDIGIKASPGGANEPASTITFGELDITIFFS